MAPRCCWIMCVVLSLRQQRLLLCLPFRKIRLQGNPGLGLLQLLQVVLTDIGLHQTIRISCVSHVSAATRGQQAR